MVASLMAAGTLARECNLEAMPFDAATFVRHYSETLMFEKVGSNAEFQICLARPGRKSG